MISNVATDQGPLTPLFGGASAEAIPPFILSLHLFSFLPPLLFLPFLSPQWVEQSQGAKSVLMHLSSKLLLLANASAAIMMLSHFLY